MIRQDDGAVRADDRIRALQKHVLCLPLAVRSLAVVAERGDQLGRARHRRLQLGQRLALARSPPSPRCGPGAPGTPPGRAACGRLPCGSGCRRTRPRHRPCRRRARTPMRSSLVRTSLMRRILHSRLRHRMLRRRLHPLARLAVDPALPCPLVLVSHVKRERPDARDRGHDRVAILHRAEPLVVRAAADDVAGVQRRHRGDVGHQLVDRPLHVAGRVVLAALAVDVDGDAQRLRVGDLVFGDDPGTERGEGIERLAEEAVDAGAAQTAGRDIVVGDVAEDRVHRLGVAQVLRLAADHDRDLRLMVEDVGLVRRQDDRVAGSRKSPPAT